MGKETAIAWTDATFNPWWGCAKVSPGCDHCYADAFAKRLGLKVWGTQADHRRFGDKHWNEPRKWNALAEKAGVRRRVFCASMADVFEGRPEDDADRARLWELIEMTPALDWLLLTKRPQNMVRLAPSRWVGGWPRNVWAGTTAEDQPRAEERVPHLLSVPAVVRFLSVEPMLGPVALDYGHWLNACADVDQGGINWIIVGGESGHGARPFDLEWALSIVAQCADAGVACFVKQLGARPIVRLRAFIMGVPMSTGDPKGGDPDEWPEDLRVRQFPEVRP